MHWEKWTEERKGKEVGEGGEFGENMYGKKWTEEREGREERCAQCQENLGKNGNKNFNIKPKQGKKND